MRASNWQLALMGLALGLAASPILAQTPEDALTAAWLQVCPGAVPGSSLAQRCAEIAAGGPGSRAEAAAGNFLEEIPGQGRSSTREQASRENEQRVDISAKLSLFASADTGRLDRDPSEHEAAFAGNTDSITIGMDWAFHPQWLLGVALSHDQERLDFDESSGSARGKYTGGLGYLGWNPTDALGLNGYLGRLDGSNELKRAIDYTLLNGTSVQAIASADPDSTRTIAGLGLDWSLAQGAWGWLFGAGVDWTRTELDPYTETGGDGLALSVPRRKIETRRGRLDATLMRTVSQSWGVWQPQLKIGLRHEFENPSRALAVSFATDPNEIPIVFDTEDPDTSWGEWALGSSFVFTHGHSGFIQYRQRFGHAFLQERVIAIGWRMELP
jgi:outer membrane autotransporter protein